LGFRPQAEEDDDEHGTLIGWGHLSVSHEFPADMASRAGVPSRLVAGLRPTAPRNTLATPKPAALAEGAVDKKDAPEQGGLRWADALRWCRKVSALNARGLARRGDWRRLLRRLDAREDGAQNV
jgi:hypothetical protein